MGKKEKRNGNIKRKTEKKRGRMGRSSAFWPIKHFWLAHREPRLDRGRECASMRTPLPSRGVRMALPGGAHWSDSKSARSTPLTEMSSRAVILFLPSSYRTQNPMPPLSVRLLRFFPFFTSLWIYMRVVETPFLLSPSTDRTPIALPGNPIADVGLVNGSEVVAVLEAYPRHCSRGLAGGHHRGVLRLGGWRLIIPYHHPSGPGSRFTAVCRGPGSLHRCWR
jgi:hypothetical protein